MRLSASPGVQQLMMLSPRRLFFGTSTAIVLVAFLATLAASSRAVTGSARKRADASTRHLDGTLSHRDDSTRAIVLGYLERARLGLGSPFRLIEQSIRDPRLSDSMRLDVAWTLVGRVLDNRVYEIDARALDLLGPPGAGAGHLELIEDVLEGADEPRVAEASIRLAYGLASANGTTGLNSTAVVIEVAAQVRDRVLAGRDMRRAIPRADADGIDLIDEIIQLRATRDLGVEQPLLIPLTVSQREAAIDATPALLRRIESLAEPRAPARTRATTLLDKNALLALARIGARFPPLGATRVITSGRAATLRSDSTLDREAVAILGRSTNEESLVAAYAYADMISGGRSASLARLMVTAGVAIRAQAQDRVWFPGDPTPSIGSVVGRFGLKSITFDRSIPAAWRPFYATMISSSLEDFGRVMAGYAPTGLSFHVSANALPDSALAMHDPSTHTIRLSSMTPSGTLAHELAHDVDWQAARRLFARSGGYATDRSVRERPIRLSSAMRGLTTARVAGRMLSRQSARPAEVFARSMDWFVADALAGSGRTNGYLTAIEDPLLAGFATNTGDAASLDAATALVRSLAEMTYVPDSVGAAYVARWEALDRLDPSTIFLRVMDAPIITRRGGRPPFGFAPWAMLDIAAGALCRVEALRKGSAQDRLLAMTIDARAKGIVVRRARLTAEGNRPAWARAILGEPMWNPRNADDLMRRTTAAVAEGAARAGLFALAPAPFDPGCD